MQQQHFKVARSVGLVLTLMNLDVLQAAVTSPDKGMPTAPCCPVSPAGVPGIPGHPGPYGPAGHKGDNGSPGDVGMQGAKGDKGSDGLNGERGTAGGPGQKGEQGVGQPGKQGPQGLPGIAGLMGERGVPGPIGIQGIRGPIGSKGDKGSPGDVGMHGAKGDKGSNGIKGKQGPPGLAALKGERGAPGPVGLKGHQGECVERTRRVAFSVARNTGFTEASTSLPFEEILFEVGTNFDLPSGTFTCSAAGIYVLMFSLMKQDSAEKASANLKKNGDLVVRGTTYGAGNFVQAGNSAVLSLQEGDRVFLEPDGSLASTNHHQTSFSGFLLFGEN